MSEAQSTATGSTAALDRPLGNVRPVWWTLLLIIFTLGIWGLWWYYVSHKEMREFSGSGLGGWAALVFGIIPILSPILWFTMPTEIAHLYEDEQQQGPVRTLTGLWMLIPIVGAIVWFYKVQEGLNRFWQAKTRELVEAVG